MEEHAATQNSMEIRSNGSDVAERTAKTSSGALMSAAAFLRERAGNTGIRRFADTAASGLEQAAGYVEGTPADDVMERVGDVIRRNPVRALLIGVGFGMVLGHRLTHRGN